MLDVGCGSGATSRHMAERVGLQGRVVGVDISITILAVAKERAEHISNLRFEVGDAQTMDLGEDAFDLIYSRFGVMFFQDAIAAFTNLHRALKPTGRLKFLAWRAAAENPWMQQPVTAIQEIFPPPPNSNPDVPDPNAPGPFSLAQLERLHHVLQSAGFTEVQVEAIDNHMRMGSADEAISLILGMMGPSIDQMSLATHEQLTTLHDSIRRVVAHYDTAEYPSAASRALGVRILTTRRVDHAGESSGEYRYDLYWLHSGFIYLVAVMDWFSRYVLSWSVSITMEVGFCLEALEQALEVAKPEIFNTDPGVQFTSVDFRGRLESAGIEISMDGRGRALDHVFVERLWRTVKYEDLIQ